MVVVVPTIVITIKTSCRSFMKLISFAVGINRYDVVFDFLQKINMTIECRDKE